MQNIGDVRGLGCMNAIELVKDRDTLEPDGDMAAKVAQIALKKGLILVTAAHAKRYKNFGSSISRSESYRRGLRHSGSFTRGSGSLKPQSQ